MLGRFSYIPGRLEGSQKGSTEVGPLVAKHGDVSEKSGVVRRSLGEVGRFGGRLSVKYSHIRQHLAESTDVGRIRPELFDPTRPTLAKCRPSAAKHRPIRPNPGPNLLAKFGRCRPESARIRSKLGPNSAEIDPHFNTASASHETFPKREPPRQSAATSRAPALQKRRVVCHGEPHQRRRHSMQRISTSRVSATRRPRRGRRPAM